MTAISKRAKEKIYKKFKNTKNFDSIKAVMCLFLGFCGGQSSWQDIAMDGIVLVMARCADDLVLRYSIIAGGMLSCGFLAVADTAYIPYFLSYVIYTVVHNLTGKDVHALFASLAVLSAGKIILTYFSYSVQYKLLAVTESIALYYIVQIAKAGVETLKSGRDTASFTDCLCEVLTVCIPVIALSGRDSHALYPGAALALALGWFFAASLKISSGISAIITVSIAVLDKQGFVYLFIAFSILLFIGGFLAEKVSVIIYPVCAFASLVLNIVFISEVNSFVITGSTILALIIYAALPYTVDFQFNRHTEVFSDGRDWRLLMLSMKKLENSLNFLAGCAIDISRLNEKNMQPGNIEDMVAQDVCRKCEKSAYCWQEKYSFTRQQFSEYGKKMYWAGENNFSPGFWSQCINIERIISSFEENSRLLLSKKYILQSRKNNQKILQNAFLSISAAVSDLIYQNQHSYLINTAITLQTDRFLKDIGVSPTYCLCAQNPDQTSFAVLQPLEQNILYKIQLHLESLYGVKFSPPQMEQQGVETLYIFNSQPLFGFDIAVESTPYKNINGDNYDYFVQQGFLYILLSDGMGTGSLAAAESQTVIAMARSLINTGISMKNAINIINLALNLKGSGESSASLDILAVDLFTGKAVITKAGAGVSMVLDRQGVTRYYQDSLPLGILKEIKPVECDFTMSAGDTAVIMSDGAGIVSNGIKDMYTDSCQRIAEFISQENTTKDDKTVIAVRLKINA